MLWKTPDGDYLVQGKTYPITLRTMFRLPDGEILAEATEYRLFALDGTRLQIIPP